MRIKITRRLAFPMLLLSCAASYGAKPVDLGKQPISLLKTLVAASPQGNTKRNSALLSSTGNAQDDLKELTRNVDFKGTTHIRVQQTHDGYPVWGADAIVHVPEPTLSKRSVASLASAPSAKSSMTGVVYQNLANDLQNAPASVYTEAQASKALAEAEKLASLSYSTSTPAKKDSKLIVYVDDANQAHWAYLTTLYYPVTATNKIPARPYFILDAVTFKVYQEWNDVKSRKAPHLTQVEGGGLGGNDNEGKLVYDGLGGDLAKLEISRDDTKKTCYLANSLAEVRNAKKPNEALVSFHCDTNSVDHNQVFWDGTLEEANGGYSPANDALYAGFVIKSLYKDWYNYDMLTDDNGKPMKLKLVVHSGDDWENAMWDSGAEEIYLGDGADSFYPLTSLGVIAHEVSHGFTQQHSNLVYQGQSGALNESFSDMASMAAESFAYGENTWQIGSEISKKPGEPIRYLDQPTKDCASGASPGNNCSIDTADQYDDLITYSKRIKAGDLRNGYVVHLASGVFNRAFYLIANSKDWDVKKTFAVMIQANANYWTANAEFNDAACGVLKAAKDFGYDVTAPTDAFKKVGVDTSQC